MKKLTEEFINPGSEYRGAPFWAWNGELEPDELRQQIRSMHEMGLGGFFMHSRVGLATEYLSPRWFECIEACIDEAEKLDMQAWLYDEDRWPSGAAGGIVTANPEYRARKIICEELNDASKVNKNADTLAFYLADIDGGNARNLERLETVPSSIPDGKTLAHFYIEEEKPSSWYNGQTYLDTLNEAAVKKFIEVTHDAYLKKFGDEFGKRIPGMFTDEPNYGRVWFKWEENKHGSPWTAQLPEVFKERYGYDLLENLPELFYFLDGVEVSKVKINYIDCLTHLFVNAFSKQIGEWCEKHNMLSTGHMLTEDSLSDQTLTVGSCMRSYEYMQAPGIDMLTEHWRAYDTAKQLGSAARQFDCKWRLSETYGCTGWDFPFAGHKAVGDWQAALGVNLRCQHLSWYTMEGEAKRDYPASIFYQSPWFREYSKVEDYFARINLAMSQGREIIDVLVIQPLESVWSMIGKNWWEGDTEVKKLDRKIVELRDCLLGANIDFDYGDEDIIARHGAVDGEVFKIKQAEYKVIVVPEMLTVRASTIKLLETFAAQGGRVIFAGAPAKYVDAEKSPAMETFAATCASFKIGEELVAEIAGNAGRVSITDNNGQEIFNTLYQHREDEENAYLFICNVGHEEKPLFQKEDSTLVIERTKAIPSMTVTLKTAKTGTVLEVDLESGKATRVNAEKTAEGWTIKTSLAALGSRLFIVSADSEAMGLSKAEELKTLSCETIEAADYEIALSEDNVLPLAVAGYKIGNNDWAAAEHVLGIDKKIRTHLGVQCRGGQMKQPWVSKGLLSTETVSVKLAYEFFCEVIPSGELFLGLEKPETFTVSFNGRKISATDCGWWCDRSLRKLAVEPEMLKIGKNELLLECEYSEEHPGLEYIYLLGNFGTKFDGLKQTLTVPVKTLSIGDWVEQGLAFYSGAVGYKCDINIDKKAAERIFIKLPEYRGACAKILVNGREAGVVAWEPNELDITDYLNDGKNTVMIELFSSRRNSHGPFFNSEKWPIWTGPGSYDEYTGKFGLVPCGLMKAPKLIVKG